MKRTMSTYLLLNVLAAPPNVLTDTLRNTNFSLLKRCDRQVLTVFILIVECMLVSSIIIKFSISTSKRREERKTFESSTLLHNKTDKQEQGKTGCKPPENFENMIVHFKDFIVAC